MRTAIRNLIGAALLILTIGVSSCLAFTESGAEPAADVPGATD